MSLATSPDALDRPRKRGCVHLGNGLLIALGVGVLVLHGWLVLDANQPPNHPDLGWQRLGVAMAAVPSVLVAIPLGVAGRSSGVVPRPVRRIELTLASVILVGVGVEFAVVWIGV